MWIKKIKVLITINSEENALETYTHIEQSIITNNIFYFEVKNLIYIYDKYEREEMAGEGLR